MFIKYTGEKEKKVVTVNVTGKGVVQYEFTPTCELNDLYDKDAIDFLLHSDRQGLFEVVKEVVVEKVVKRRRKNVDNSSPTPDVS